MISNFIQYLKNSEYNQAVNLINSSENIPKSQLEEIKKYFVKKINIKK